MSMTQVELAKLGAQILAAFIASDDDLDDVDRTVDMAAYMAKRLALAVDAPLADLQAAVWPDSISADSAADDSALDELARITAYEASEQL